MLNKVDRKKLRQKKHGRMRQHIQGTAQRPRLSVFRSLNHIYAQVIDDQQGVTLAAASSLDPDLRSKLSSGGNIEAAQAVGSMVAEKALARGIRQVVFDRGGNLYHGRIAALAQAAREAGLDF